MVGKLRPGVVVVVVVVVVVITGVVMFVVVRFTADDGDAAADLVRARSLVGRTATMTGIQRGQGFHVDGIGVCMDSFGVGRASMSYPLDLKGQPPAAVLRSVADFWSASASDILGVRLSVTTDATKTGEVSRVSASGHGWSAAVKEQLGQGKGTYEFVADGPCTANTKGSIGPIVTNPPSPSTHRCLESSESFRGDIDGDVIADTGDVCLTGRDQAQVIVNSSKCGMIRSDTIGAFDPKGIYGSVDNGDGTRLVLVNAYNNPEGPNLDVFSLSGCSLHSVRDDAGGVPGQFILNLVNAEYHRNGVVCERAAGRLQFVLRKSDRAGEGRWRTSTARWEVSNGKASLIGHAEGPTLSESDLPQPDHSLACEGVRSPILVAAPKEDRHRRTS